MKNFLFIFVCFIFTFPLKADTNVVTYDEDENKYYISEISEDGSTITKKLEIEFNFNEDNSFIDSESGNIFFYRDEAPDGCVGAECVNIPYYYVYDPQTETFSGARNDGKYAGYIQMAQWTSMGSINGAQSYAISEGIASNKTNIQSTQNSITTNTSNISSNDDDIATNKTNIAKNADDIATNKTNIAKNADDIATNKTNIAKNADDIATNKTNIATNATNIATNATNIATNKSNIETNALGIANNSLRIDNLAALVNSNVDRIEGLETLTGLMRNEYRTGIASSIALSQIQYASDGFSIGVGHGEFKDKDEMAVGIGYGGQFNEKVGYQFQFGSSGDSTGFGFTIRF